MFLAMIRTGSLIITQEMLSLIAEIDEFKGAWRALGKLAPDMPSSKGSALSPGSGPIMEAALALKR